MGYDTGDTPANDYLKNIGIQFIIQNLMGIHPAFQYGPSNQGAAFYHDILKSDQGRHLLRLNPDQDLVGGGGSADSGTVAW